MREDCPIANENCKYHPRCFSDIDHYWYPKTDYKTAIEKEFRELPEFKRQICREQHDERHRLETPPPKPDLTFMREAIRRYRNGME